MMLQHHNNNKMDNSVILDHKVNKIDNHPSMQYDYVFQETLYNSVMLCLWINNVMMKYHHVYKN